MADTFARLYHAKPFDPEDRRDQIAETARIALIDATQRSGVQMQPQSGEEVQYLLGGLLVGLVQVMQASMPRGDVTMPRSAPRSCRWHHGPWIWPEAPSGRSPWPMPDRIQLSRAKGWRMPPNTVKVDRSTAYGNPWGIGSPGRLKLREMASDYLVRLPIDQASAVNVFRLWLTETPAWWMLPPPDMFTTPGWETLWRSMNVQRQAILTRLPELRGKNLACWCKPGCPCHADILLELANG